ncbi:MAG: hypothetical protein K9H62_11995, partial [Bacteroidales bacterium]|nr:hypothetical protein [Bacteroidales bacterium]
QFSAKIYPEAKTSYQTASKIKPVEDYPKEQISKIEQILADLAKAEAEAKARDEAYNKTIATADKSFAKEEFTGAKTSYQEASGLKPEKSYPKEQIAKIDQILAERAQKEAELAALNKNYDDLIAKADADFSGKSYETSKSNYQQALVLKPAEKYPKDRIAEIERILNEIAAAETAAKSLEESYQAAITIADQQFSAKIYPEAKTSYQTASKIKPAEAYPKDQISKIDQILADLAKSEAEAKARDEAYNKAIAAADKAFQKEEFPSAKSSYQEASGLKPEESYPKEQIAKIDQILAERAQKEAEIATLNKNYEDLIAKADAEFSSGNYESSISNYQQALILKPAEIYPKERIAEIEQKLKELAEAEKDRIANQKKYDELIAKADESFKREKLDMAKSTYISALEILHAEPYPTSMIAKIDSLLMVANNKEGLLAIEKEYNAAIGEADKLFSKKKWDQAKDKYFQAVEIKPAENYPKQKIKEIDKILSDIAAEKSLQQKETEYAGYIKIADQQYSGHAYPEALGSYRAASELFPARKYPKEKIDIINKLLAEQAAKQKSIEDERQYKEFIRKADLTFNQSDYGIAKINYISASEIKPSETYPKERIALIDDILRKQQAKVDEAARLNEAYNKAIESADFEFNSQQYEASKEDYQKAIIIKPEASYPKEQIRKINDILEKLRLKKQYALENEDAYLKALERGDKALTFSEYTVARFYFNQAKDLRPEEALPIKKLDETQRLWDIAQQTKLDAEYNSNIDQGDTRMKEEAFVAARFFYHKAGELKPEEALPKQKLDAVETAIQQKNFNETYKSYLETIAKADRFFEDKDYSVAEYYYEIALQIKGDEEHPMKKLEEIKNLKANLEEVEKQSAYTRAIDRADRFYANQEYTAARYFYFKALEYMENKDHPKKRIEEIKKIFDPEFKAKLEAYNNAIRKANSAFDHKDYKLAKTWYEKALNLKETDDHAKARLKEIKGLSGAER